MKNMKIMQMERRIYPKRKDFTGESASDKKNDDILGGMWL